MARARLTMTPVPEPTVARDAGVVGLGESVRVVNQNFRQIRDLIERAIITGGLIGDGSIVSTMLSTDARTLVGDVTGLIGATADGGATTVEKIRGKSIAAPVAGDDTKAIVYNHAGSNFTYADVLRDVLTTRGDMLRRGASAEERFAVGGANTILKSDGTDPAWGTVTALLDALFSSSQGAILYRDASAWAALAPGTSGHFLKTQGAAANPVWAAAAGGLTSPLTTKGDIWAFSTLDARFPVGATDGHVLTVDSTQTFGFKWAAAGGSNALLDGAVHTDTVAQTVSRGSLVYGNSTPKWDELVIGASGKFLRSNGTDVSWQFPRKLPANRSPVYYLSLGGSGVITSNGVIASTLAGGTEADAAETGAGSRFANKYTQAVLNGVTGRRSSVIFKGERAPVFYADFKIAVVNTGASSVMLFKAGFSANLPGNARAGNNSACVLWEQGVDTNFRFFLRDASTSNDIDTGVAKDEAWHDLLIYSPDNGTTWTCELDGVQVASSSTNVPVSTTAIQAGVTFSTIGAGASNTPEIRNGYQHAWEGGVP